MDQVNTETRDSQDQVVEQEVQIENVSPTGEGVSDNNNSVSPALEEEKNNEKIAEIPETNKTYTQADVERLVQEKFAREKRKVRREAMQEYSIPTGQGTYNIPANPYIAAPQQQIQASVNHYQQQQNSQLTPDQQAEMYLATVVQQNVQAELAKITEAQRRQEANSFYQKVQEHAAGNEDFDDFLNYDCDRLARQVGQGQLAGLFEISRKFNDPTILFDIHKQNAEEFKKLASMDPIMQAAKIGEFRARKSLQTRKVVSNAPPPVSEPTSKTSSYSSSNSVTDMVAQRLAARKK